MHLMVKTEYLDINVHIFSKKILPNSILILCSLLLYNGLFSRFLQKVRQKALKCKDALRSILPRGDFEETAAGRQERWNNEATV